MFTEVLIPPAVLAELLHPSGREDMRGWIEQRPSWLQLRQVQGEPARELLNTFEAEALQLALEMRADFVLMDEPFLIQQR